MITGQAHLCRVFLNAHEKRTTKASQEGTKMSCDRLTLGKIIFGYTPRVVLPPQQPVLNATMEEVQRWGEDVSNDGLDAI
jgi:hypothetical protein